MALPGKNINHQPSRKRGKNVNFIEHMDKFSIKMTLFWHFKVIIEDLQALIHIKGPTTVHATMCNG